MNEVLLAACSAFWLGVLTSISPCPLATNIIAISYIGKNISKTSNVFWSGLIYTFGRATTYLMLSVFIVSSLISIPQVSFFLQQYMNKILGPILILSGMVLLELIKFSLKSLFVNQSIVHRLGKGNVFGTFLIGLLFALSFCPVSAALYFGSLLPLSLKYQSSILFPSLYGIGTAFPLLIVAVVLSMGSHAIGRTFNVLTTIERWTRSVTGWIFILVGIYYTLVYIFQL